MKVKTWIASALTIAGFVACTANAAPINYTSIGASPVTGTLTIASGVNNDPLSAVYYSFAATTGSNVVITGARLDGGLDLAFWVFSGLFSDTGDFGGTFDPSDAGFIDSADDELPAAIPGPWGDPQSTFLAPITGYYTIAVVSFLSSGQPPYDFRLTVTGNDVPEPESLALLGLGLAGAAFARRRTRIV